MPRGEVLRLAELRYRGGVVGDPLEVLDAQRSLFAAELEEVQTDPARTWSPWCASNKALGGGWTPAALDAPPARPDAADQPANPDHLNASD